MKNYLNTLWLKFVGLFKKEEIIQYKPNIFDGLGVDELSILIGSDLVEFGNDIVNTLKLLRHQIKKECGFVLPTGRIMNDTTLQENEYRILVREHIKYIGFAIPNRDYAIPEIKNNLYNVCQENLEELFSVKTVEKYISYYLENENSILKYTILDFLTITDIKQIFVYLLKNGQSIKDIEYIFEKMCEYSSVNRDKYCFRNPMFIAENILEDLHQKDKTFTAAPNNFKNNRL